MAARQPCLRTQTSRANVRFGRTSHYRRPALPREPYHRSIKGVPAECHSVRVRGASPELNGLDAKGAQGVAGRLVLHDRPNDLGERLRVARVECTHRSQSNGYGLARIRQDARKEWPARHVGPQQANCLRAHSRILLRTEHRLHHGIDTVVGSERKESDGVGTGHEGLGRTTETLEEQPLNLGVGVRGRDRDRPRAYRLVRVARETTQHRHEVVVPDVAYHHSRREIFEHGERGSPEFRRGRSGVDQRDDERDETGIVRERGSRPEHRDRAKARRYARIASQRKRRGDLIRAEEGWHRGNRLLTFGHRSLGVEEDSRGGRDSLFLRGNLRAQRVTPRLTTSVWSNRSHEREDRGNVSRESLRAHSPS